MDMSAGKLDRRVQVLRRVNLSPDTFGGFNGDWEELGDPLPAARADVSDSERWRAGRLEGELLTRFTVRASTFARGIRRSDRLFCDGVEFEIDGIKETAGRRAFLEITAIAVVD